MKLIRWLAALYRKEPAAAQSAAAALYALGTLAWHVHTGTALWSWPIAGAAVVAVYGLLVRAQVMPMIKLSSVPAPPGTLAPTYDPAADNPYLGGGD